MKRSVSVVAALLLLGSTTTALAAQRKVSLKALIHETQHISEKHDEMTLVWWIPTDFWRIAVAKNPTVTQTQIDQIVSVMSPYTVIVVVDGKLGPFGGVTYRPEADIRATVQIRDRKGATYRPLSQARISPDAGNLLVALKPVLKGIAGPLGQNMVFCLFPATDKRGQPIAAPRKEGTLTVLLGNREFRWRLPLSSLIPPKICAKCKAEVSGAFKFCPWCGTKLPPRKQ